MSCVAGLEALYKDDLWTSWLDKVFSARTCFSIDTRHPIQCFLEFIHYRNKNNTYIIKQALEYSHSWENTSLEIRVWLLQNWVKLVESSLQFRCYTCLGPERYTASIRTVRRKLLNSCWLHTLWVTEQNLSPPFKKKVHSRKHSKVTGLFLT